VLAVTLTRPAGSNAATVGKEAKRSLAALARD